MGYGAKRHLRVALHPAVTRPVSAAAQLTTRKIAPLPLRLIPSIRRTNATFCSTPPPRYNLQI